MRDYISLALVSMLIVGIIMVAMGAFECPPGY